MNIVLFLPSEIQCFEYLWAVNQIIHLSNHLFKGKKNEIKIKIIDHALVYECHVSQKQVSFLNPWTFLLALSAVPVSAAHPLTPGAPLQSSVSQVSPLRTLPEHPNRIGPRWTAQAPQSAQW